MESDNETIIDDCGEILLELFNKLFKYTELGKDIYDTQELVPIYLQYFPEDNDKVKRSLNNKNTHKSIIKELLDARVKNCNDPDLKEYLNYINLLKSNNEYNFAAINVNNNDLEETKRKTLEKEKKKLLDFYSLKKRRALQRQSTAPGELLLTPSELRAKRKGELKIAKRNSQKRRKKKKEEKDAIETEETANLLLSLNNNSNNGGKYKKKSKGKRKTKKNRGGSKKLRKTKKGGNPIKKTKKQSLTQTFLLDEVSKLQESHKKKIIVPIDNNIRYLQTRIYNDEIMMEELYNQIEYGEINDNDKNNILDEIENYKLTINNAKEAINELFIRRKSKLKEFKDKILKMNLS